MKIVVSHTIIQFSYLLGIESLETFFREISDSTLKEFTEKNISTEEMRKVIPYLPQKLRKPSSGGHTSDIGKIFSYLDANVWSIIDYNLLASIIHFNGSDELKQSMEKYEQDLSLFEQQTTVSQLMEFWPGRRHFPHEDVQCDITFKVRKDSDMCLLEQLRFLRKEFCSQFLPPKSELSVLYGSFTYGSSVMMKLYLPIDIVPDLVSNLSEHDSASFFIGHDIESFRVRDVLMYPAPKTNGKSVCDIKSKHSQLVHLAIIGAH